MKVLKVSEENFKITTDVLLKNGTVVFPTETAYGLAGNPFSKEVINKIYMIKGRGFDKPLPLIADSLETVEKYFELNLTERSLAEKFWPGPLTLILKCVNSRLKGLNKQGSDIAVRVSSDELARNLANSLDGLIVSTSANISGEPECYDIESVVKQFENIESKPDLILDAGKLEKEKPSTIILVEGEEIKIIRQGEIVI